MNRFRFDFFLLGPEEEAARDADPAPRAKPLLGLAPNIYSKSDDGHFICFCFSRFWCFFHIQMASSFSSPWPDPNSPVLSKIDFGVPLVELFKWLDVRDTLLGQNCKEQDITSALALARDCNHPDAEWLTSILEGKDVSKKEYVREVFLFFENDARALCFACWLTNDREEDLSLLRRASEMGNAFACSTLCWDVNEEEAFRLAQFVAAHRERDGFYILGSCFRDGRGCEKDLNSAEENYLIAAELGDVVAAVEYGGLLDDSDPARWLWFGRGALHGRPHSFLGYFSKQVELFFSGSGNATVVFLIGRTLNGNIDIEKKEIFGPLSMFFNFVSLIGPANQAVSFYSSQIKSARLAVDTWTLLSTRLHVIKDMRILIGKMIWESRYEANYVIENDPAPLASPDRKRFRK